MKYIYLSNSFWFLFSQVWQNFVFHTCDRREQNENKVEGENKENWPHVSRYLDCYDIYTNILQTKKIPLQTSLHFWQLFCNIKSAEEKVVLTVMFLQFHFSFDIYYEYIDEICSLFEVVLLLQNLFAHNE